MKAPKKYASYEEFEREEYLSVKSFYANLEDIADEGIFTAEQEDERDRDGRGADRAAELEF